MIHRQKDEQKIWKLRDILRKFVSLPDGRQLTFCLEDIGFPFIADKFDYFEKSLQRSRYKFVYIGDDFSSENCDADEDAFQWRLNKHYALNEMIKRKDSSVVPVTDNPRTKIPTLLDIFRRLDIWKLLKYRSLDDVTNVGSLRNEDIDDHTIRFISGMFEPTALPTPR